MRLEKTLQGDWINLEQAQSLYVAEMQNNNPYGPTSDFYRVALYARFSPQQIYVIKVYTHSGEDTPEIRKAVWINAKKDLDELANELKNESQPVALSKEDKLLLEQLNKINEAFEGLTKLEFTGPATVLSAGPKKRAPRKKVNPDE